MRGGAMVSVVAAVMAGMVGMSLAGCSEGGPPAIRTAGRAVVLTPAAPMKLLTETRATQIYTADGKPGSSAGPILIVTRSSKVFQREETRQAGPETFVQESEDVRSPTGLTTVTFSAGGLSGYATEGEASRDKRRVRVYCAQLFAADGTHTLFGFAPVDDAAGFAAIKATAASMTVP